MSVSARTYIELGQYVYGYVCEVKVKSTWKNLTDTCTITMPKKAVHVRGKKATQDLIKVGDKALVKFGYDNNLVERFKGYVSSVKPGMPMEFKLEDEMYNLKRMPVENKSWEDNVKVEDVLKYIGVKKYKLIGNGSIDIQGSFTLQDCKNAAQALIHLKDALPIAFFFRNGTLIVGDPYKVSNPKKVYLTFGYNVIDHSLEFKSKDDVKIKVEAISKHDTGKDVKVVVGDSGGETHTYHVGMNLKEADVRKIAEANLDKFKWSGWRGKVTLFGEPVVNHGDIAVFNDPDKEIEGSYWIDEVESSSGTGGIRQELLIGRKLND